MRAVLAAVVLLGLATSAAATPWQLQPGSTLGFAATTQGERFEGRFARFDARIRFDPDALVESRFEVVIALTSVDTANSERDEALRGPDFFAVGAHPEAHYSATRFRAIDDGGFVAEGELRLNGRTQPVPLHFTWAVRGEGAVLEGRAELDRLDFGLGEGDWSDPDMIGHRVEVRTRLLLAPAGG